MGLTLQEAERLGIGAEHPDHPARRAARAAEVAAGAGRWTLELPGCRPPLLNELMRGHRLAAHRRKAAFTRRLIDEAALAGIPPATGKRYVRLVVTDKFRGGLPDPDAAYKAVHDALVRAGLLVDDSAAFCDFAPAEFRRGARGTVVLLEDVGEATT